MIETIMEYATHALVYFFLLCFIANKSDAKFLGSPPVKMFVCGYAASDAVDNFVADWISGGDLDKWVAMVIENDSWYNTHWGFHIIAIWLFCVAAFRIYARYAAARDGEECDT